MNTAIPPDIWDVLTEVLDTDGAVRWWLSHNRTLDGHRPVDVAATPEGRQRVLNLLNALADGNFA